MGTPDFAVESLKALVENDFNVVGVITSPDKPSGRGQKINQSAVKIYADQNNLHTLQPTNLKDPIFQEELKALNADLQIIVAFRMLPQSVWSMPRLGSINLHASLLPHYRGAAPINWAVISGEKETGATTFFLKHEIDTGDILFQEKIDITPEDNAGSVHDRLMQMGANLLVKTVDKVITSDYTEIPQNDITTETLKHAPKIFKNDCKINWENIGTSINNMIRGLSPYPAAWCELESTESKPLTCKLFKTNFEPMAHQQENGTISLSDDVIKIACSDGFINVYELQLAGKKRMKSADLLRGFKQIEQYKAK